MNNPIHEWRSEIKTYCDRNGLDFDKVMHSGRCWGKNHVFFQHVDPASGKDGLRNETPAPVVLKVTRSEKGLVFEQTEYTQRYIARH